MWACLILAQVGPKVDILDLYDLHYAWVQMLITDETFYYTWVQLLHLSSTHLPARFLKVKSHRFSFFHRPGYHTFSLDDCEVSGATTFHFAKEVLLPVNKSNSNEEEVIQISVWKEHELKDPDQYAETYQVRQPILTKLTRHCRTRWFFFSLFFLLSSPSSIPSLSLIAT